MSPKHVSLFRLGSLILGVGFGSTAWSLDRTKAPSQYMVEAWGSKDGLRQATIRAVTQTPDGYLWLATVDGLVRFDGVRFTTFNSRNTGGFGHDYLHALQETPDGSLWVGTYAGLTRLKDGKFVTYTEKDGLSDSFIWRFARARDGLWIGGWRGLTHFSEGRFRTMPRFAGRSVRAVLESRDGTLWVGVGQSLHHVAGERATVYGTREGLPRDVRFTALAQASDGTLWIGTEQGLGHLANGSLRFFTSRDGLSGDHVRAIHEDRDGQLWIGTTAGLCRFADGQFARLPRGLSDDAVESIYEDREGSLWIGTAGGGLNRLRDGRFTPYGRPEGLREHRVWAVYESADGGLWMGTEGNGLSRLRGGVLTRYGKGDGLPDGIAFTIAPARDGGLWVGMNTGLVRLHDHRTRSYGAAHGLAAPSVRAVLEDSRRRLWVGTATGGLYERVGERFVPVRPPPVAREDVYVSAILEGRDGSVWFGTDAGLWRLRGTEFDVYTSQNGLPGDYAAGLMEEADGTLWVGTNPGGLARFKDGRWTAVPRDAGLPDDNVNAMVDDGGGTIWFSSDRAIFSVAKRELHALADGAVRSVAARSFNVSDGLRSAQGSSGFPAIWMASDRRLWFATARGAVVIDPQHLRPNPIAPPVYIEGLASDGAAVPLGGRVELAPGRGKLEILYTAPSLRAPDRVRFKYRLEGFDTDWVEPGNRRVAYYTNVPPGRYRFRVVASNDDGVWNEAGAVQEFRLLPHFYQTTWFSGLIACVVLAGAVGVHRLRVRHLKRRQRALARQVEEALAEVKVLTGLLPICSGCKKIRDDHGSWSQIESYIQDHSHAEFSHGICPQCMERLYPAYAARPQAGLAGRG